MENRIASRLRDQLGMAKNGSEMFRIFSKFNALFVRPHIRGAIKEYQVGWPKSWRKRGEWKGV